MKTKRPAFRPGDSVTLASHVRTPIRMEGSADILRDTVLRVSCVTGRGTLRAPWEVSVTDGASFWKFDPSDIEAVS
jgi:hypothetical protein